MTDFIMIKWLNMTYRANFLLVLSLFLLQEWGGQAFAAGRSGPEHMAEESSDTVVAALSTESGRFLAFRHAENFSDFAVAANLAAVIVEQDGKKDFNRYAFAYNFLQGNYDEADLWFQRVELASPDWQKEEQTQDRDLDIVKAHLSIYRLIKAWENDVPFVTALGNRDALTPPMEWVRIGHDILTFWRAVEDGRQETDQLVNQQVQSWSDDFDGQLVDILGDILTVLATYKGNEPSSSPTLDAQADRLKDMIENLPPQLALRVISTLESQDKPTNDLRDRLLAKESGAQIVVSHDAPISLTPKQNAAVMMVYLGGTQLTFGPLQALMWARFAMLLDPDYDTAKLLAAEAMASLFERHNNQDQMRLALIAIDAIEETSSLKMAAELLRVRLYNQDDNSSLALELVAETQAQFGEFFHPFVLEGQIHSTAKDFEQAISAFSKAIDLFGSGTTPQSTVYFLRGISYERSDQWKAAEQDLKRSLSLRPNQASVMNYLAYSWVIRDENTEEALSMLSKANKLEPNRGYIIDSVGWAQYQLGLYQHAVESLEHAVVLDPSETEIIDHLGDAYWRVGRYRDARFQWQRALNYNEDSDLAAPIEKKLIDGLDQAAYTVVK